MQTTETLADLRNLLYQRGEQRWIASLALTFCVLVLTVAALWLQSTALIAALALASVITPVAVAWLRESASTHLVRGDKCRRLILYSDSFGHAIPASQLAIVRAWALGDTMSPAPFIPPYYASNSEPGPQRLADNMAEAAFFTGALATKIQLALWSAFGIAALAAAISLSLADLARSLPSETGIAAAKSIGVFLCFLISGDFAVLAKKYADLRNEARLIFESCSRMRDDPRTTFEEATAVSEDYGVALLQCPPIPSWLYLLYRDELNRLYRESDYQRSGNADAG